ncbi:MAG: DUF4199 domain-containing protein [Nonlabens sp.]|uniref:DUF4199 domain-containing protein n=1 Tax=Nonlabens sp. TaxID=1888209 RepID=UPI00321B6144
MNSVLKKTSLKFGLIGFMIFVISYFAIWQIDLSLFLNPLVTYPISIAVFILAVYAQKQAKIELGGYISFGSALLYFVVAVAIAFLGYVVAALLIFNIIDPQAKEQLLELTIQASIEMSNNMLGWLGMEEAAGQVSEEQIRSSMALSPTPMGIASIVIGYISNVAFYTVIGLISSLIIKKDQPYEFE